MKKLLLILCCFPFLLNAQVYPYDEGFTGIPSLSLPVGWEGDMKVRSGHGLNDDKCIAGDISGTDFVDSATTPWIGPLDNNTEFYFWYRMVEVQIYPFTQKDLTSDKLTISISTDSINYVNLFTIDSTNHLPNTSFRKITFPITNYGGQIVKFKLRCQFGYGSSYYVDIDSIKVRLNLNPGIAETEDSKVKIYPSISDSYVQIETDELQSLFNRVELVNACGQIIFSGPFQRETRIDLSGISSGMYFVKLYSSDRMLTRRIIIQR